MLLERYLILFRPLEKVLANVLYGPQGLQTYHEYLFVEMGKTVPSDVFSDTLQDLTQFYVGAKLGLSSYRHIAIAIKREYIPSIYRVDIGDEDEVGDLSSGHSSEMAKRVYANQRGNLPLLPSDAFQVFGTFCQKWHNVMGFGEGPVPKPLLHTVQPFAGGGGWDQDAFQAMVYSAVQDALAECLPLQQLRVEEYKKEQPAWEADIVMEEADNIMEIEPSLYDPLMALRMCYNDPNMEFKSQEQYELVKAVLEAKSDILAIIPTGGGKSAAFEVPAKVEDAKQTIVVAPFVSLMEDILERTKQLGVNSILWRSGDPWPSVHKAALLIVVSETAASKGFKE